MAQKHKAPTQVTIAPTEESPIQGFVQRYWKIAAVVAVGVVAVTVGSHYARKQAVRAEFASWERLREDVDLGAGLGAGITLPPAATLDRLADDVAEEPAGPWARGLLVHQLVTEGSYSQAAGELQKLGDAYPTHPLVAGAFQFGDARPQTLSDHLMQKMEAVRVWEKRHATLFQNPPLPADAPKVRLNTSKGSILVGLYVEQAPKHAENFLKLCREGYYDGTLFHRIGRTFMIQGGDPNTRDDPEKSSWGLGGPDYKIEPELSDLRHFPYVLAAAKTAVERESSGSQFYVTVGNPHHLDGLHTIFGAVIDGKNVVDAIAAGEIEPESTDRPRDPVELRSTEVLETSD